MRKIIIFLTAFAAAVALADEGMWMPQQVPRIAAELQKTGLKIDPNRLADLTGDPMGAVISLGGCTASFVSPQGLVVTNHHCAFGSIAFNSTAQNDLLKNGFLAKSRAEELRAAPGSRVFVTTKIEDVTDRVSGSLSATMSDLDRERAIDRREKQLVDACEKPGGVRCKVASFFEGSQYLLTTQLEIRDVRLVYAPAGGIGNFGGETDNWMWPRHTGDWSFLRAYVGKDGKPADYSRDNMPYEPAHWLKVSTKAVNPGDFVLVAGYPGRTYRYRTEMEVRNAQEFAYPTTIRYATDLNRILNEEGKGNRQTQIINASRVRSNDNLLKNLTGTLANMTSGTILTQRRQRETDLTAWLAAHADQAKHYGNALPDIERLDQDVYSTRERDLVLVWMSRSSPILTQAMSIERLASEKTRDDVDRVVGYQQRDIPRIYEDSQRAQKQLDIRSDRAGLRYFLLEAAKLPPGQRIEGVDRGLASTGATEAGAQVNALLDRLYGNTKVNELDARTAMYGETRAQLEARRDAMLDFAGSLMPLTLSAQQRDDRIAGAMSRVRPMYLAALREMTGGALYPDANSTLRISFGNVKGYSPRDAITYFPETTVSGILQKNTGSGDFDAPQALLAAIRAKKFGGYENPQLGEVTVDFLSTCDITGGNSGSPTLNANGELCGLAFDGDYEALGNDYLVDALVARSIHVDATYMLWVMDAVDGAHSLLQEMGIGPRF